jgi:NADH-quinone oxidoreductase subunit M
MTLVWLLGLPLVGGLTSWAAARLSSLAARVVALLSMLAYLMLVVRLWVSVPAGTAWLMDFRVPWIPELGINFYLALDGLSLLLLALTGFLGVISVIVSWRQIDERVGLFHLNLLWVIAGATGVFLALDLFLFAFMWELMLIPMYFLIDLWGHENRHFAAVKFFLFTQISGLFMLLAILALFFLHWQQTGVPTFEYASLLGTHLPPQVALWLMLGFTAAFAVKLPVVPLHTWLPDAHTQAPTAGSVLLAGLLLKTGGYGLLRFAVPLFPEAVHACAVPGMILAVVGITYGAFMAFAQTDLKRLIAYTSVSHLGFVFLAVFVGNSLAWQGAVIQMLSHGVSTGALFMLVGILQERLHTRDMTELSGLWGALPKLGGALLFFGMASVGLPGMGNFVGELLTLLGTYAVWPVFAILAAAGLVVSMVYALRLLERVLAGPRADIRPGLDLRAFEVAVIGLLVGATLWLGLAPQTFLDLAQRSALMIGGGAP